MTRRWLAGAVLGVAIGACHAAAVAGPIDRLTFYTEDFPPYQMRQQGRLTGMFVEVVREMFAHADTVKTVADVRVVPWPRGYRTVRHQPNTVLFGTARTEQREDLFHWVGPAVPSHQGVFARRPVAATVDEARDLNGRLTGTIRDDVADQLLRARGVSDSAIETFADQDDLVEVLTSGRLDYWAYNVQVGRHILRQHGVAGEYAVVHILRRGHNYLAVNPDSDPKAVRALRRALAEVKDTPAYERILNRYRH